MLASTSTAAVARSFQTSTLLGSNQTSRVNFSPVLLRPSMKKLRRGQRSAPTCTLTINRPGSTADEPKSPGKEKVIPTEAPKSINENWFDAMDTPDQRLVGQLRILATLASDRSEMYNILSVQRDNWNTLFHTTITMASVSAAVAEELNGAEQASGLSIVACGLGLGVAAHMALVNFFQPSQLAEEQRHAAQFFKRLATDIESTLEIDPRLRQEGPQYLQEKLATLHALESAVPLPLTPIVLEKFPKVVRPSVLSSLPVDLAEQEVRTSSAPYSNDWTPEIEDLKRPSQNVDKSDTPAYVEMATGVNHLHKSIAIASTVIATSGDICGLLGSMPGMHISILGAALTVGALFFNSLSHTAQLGAAYETYRNCAGYMRTWRGPSEGF